jgi:hypothetical protein
MHLFSGDAKGLPLHCLVLRCSGGPSFLPVRIQALIQSFVETTRRSEALCVFRERRLPPAWLFVLVIPIFAQVGSDSETEKLQKDTQNPVASLISVPIQNNNNFNIGPANRTRTF